MQFMALDVDGILRGLWASLCQLIYKVIAFLYELFMNIASVKLLTQDDIKPIYQRVTLILAIVMVFYVTLEVVKYVVEPDKMTDKEKGASNVVKRMIIVVLLIALVPTIFEKAYDLQNSLLKNQVFSKMILGRQGNDMEKVGKEFSAQMFGLFYYYDDEFWQSQGKAPDQLTCDGTKCSTVVQMNISSLATDGSIPHIRMGLNETEKVSVSKGNKQEMRKITFDGLLAVVVGGFIAYVLLMYCVDVGVRVAQLLFLQVIAPIPIIGYLAPKKDGIFQKWVKQCVTTYLDLFIRLAIICFVLLIVEILGDAYHSGTLVNNVSRTMKVFMYVAIVMGLLLFAKKAPKMLQELFPKMGAASGDFGLKPGERLKPAGRLVGFGAGAAIGAATGLGTGIAQGIKRSSAAKDKGRRKFGQIAAGIGGGMLGATKGTLEGFTRGAWNGAKKGNIVKNSLTGAKNQIKTNTQFGNRQENGYTLGHQIEDRVRNATGFASRVEKIESAKAPLKRKEEQYKEFAKTNDAIREHAFKKAKDKGNAGFQKYAEAEGRLKRLQEDESYINSLGGPNSQTYKDALSQAGQDMKKFKDAAINEYIDSNKNVLGGYDDGKLDDLFKERDQKFASYNQWASNNNKISDEATITVNGSIVTKKISDMTAEEYDLFVKQVANIKANEEARKIIDMTAKQEAIKRETEGSGIGGGKK